MLRVRSGRRAERPANSIVFFRSAAANGARVQGALAEITTTLCRRVALAGHFREKSGRSAPPLPIRRPLKWHIVVVEAYSLRDGIPRERLVGNNAEVQNMVSVHEHDLP
jgi:hypothetical protein